MMTRAGQSGANESHISRLFRSKFRLAHRIAHRIARSHLKDGQLNPFPGSLDELGVEFFFVNLTRNVAVHQHVGMTF